ncbi:MAG: glycosyltransferase [Elusimicrobia bacterium]|nr:glycosyltransferase [Elusimicrobiota bacterium]
MSSVRVLHLITRLGPGRCSGLGSAAGTASLLAGSDGSDLLACGPAGASPCPASRVEVPHLVRDISWWRDCLAFAELVALLARLRPAVLHTHTSKAGFLGRWAAWLVNRTVGRSQPIRTVHTPHGHVLYGYFGPWRSALFRALEAASSRVTDRLVAVSEAEERESLAAGLGEPGQWTVIPAGTGFEPGASGPGGTLARERFGIPRDAFVAGTVARLEPVKGVRHLIEAAGLVRRKSAVSVRDVRFLVVGDGSQRPALERLARDLGLADVVVFAGFQDDAVSLLEAMDVYVQPSLNEAMGQALLSAMARGKPVVAASVCGITDVVVDGATGLLVPPADPRALSGAVLRLLEDPLLRRRLGEAGRDLARRRDETGRPYFGSERTLRLHEELYAGLLP